MVYCCNCDNINKDEDDIYYGFCDSWNYYIDDIYKKRDCDSFEEAK